MQVPGNIKQSHLMKLEVLEVAVEKVVLELRKRRELEQVGKKSQVQRNTFVILGKVGKVDV